MKSKKFWILLLILGLPLFVVTSIYVYEHFIQPVPALLTAERRLELLREKSLALGHLDNGAYDKALPHLRTIQRDMPDEPLVHRNLLLCVFKPDLMSNEGTLSKDETAEVEVATARVLQFEPNEAHARFLCGRVYAKLAELFRAGAPGRVDQALANARTCFQEAARLAPLDAAPLFDLYLIEKFSRDPDVVSPEQLQALRAARNRAPDNTACLVELLRELMQKGDVEARLVAERLLRLLPDNVDAMHTNARPRQALMEIITSLEKAPAAPPSKAFELFNQLKGELQQYFGFYQLDLARLRPHPLSFVLEDFRPEFYAGVPGDTDSPVAVQFTPMIPLGFAGKVGLRAAFYDDLTQDGDWAIVALTGTESKTRVDVFSDRPQGAMPPLEIEGSFTQLHLADLDLDIRAPNVATNTQNIPADLDLVLYGRDGVRLLENRAEGGKRRWVDRTADCNLPPLADVRWLLVCDLDHDGNLDLVVGLPREVRILRNRGAWAFDDITSRSTGLDKLATIDAVFGDFDRDGALDLALLGADGFLVTLVNHRSGRFAVVRHDVSIAGASCLATADFNNDGRLDFVIGGPKGATLLLTNADGKGLSVPHNADLAGAPVSKILPMDFDNDGWVDLLMAGTAGGGRLLGAFRNARGGRFANLYREASVVPQLADPRSLQAADIDNDGDLDVLYVDEAGNLQALRNDGGNQNHWLKLRLRAELKKDEAGQGLAARSNFRCVGGTAEIRAGRHYQAQLVTQTVTHFGLGQHRHVDTARSIWTNGIPQSAIRPDSDTTLVENQQPKGSCPYLFTWDGERFVFVTDCFWSGGLGVKQTHNRDMPHDRQFIHLMIPGEKLKPRNGRYVLQFTNELWEGAFLDQTQLWVVDHPADVDICTNQRVPPDPKEEFRLLTVKQRRYPIAARDQEGRVVLDKILQRDGRCVDGLRRMRYVGLTEPHWLELDLGDLSRAKSATLFLTGWIWPGDTSASAAISQDPRFTGPTGVHPPALLIPVGNGGWRTASSMMGAPSGHMQTVAVPLPLDQFPPGDYRVRIATTSELYWDEAFFTVDEAGSAIGYRLSAMESQPTAGTRPPMAVKWLSVSHADLHYRGYSRMVQASPTSPFDHDYEDVDPVPRWLPIPGKSVRYGPVTRLLHEPDCRYVVMSPGDEVTLEFDDLPPPRTGWKRSFIFYANGWLKDFDLNANAGDDMAPYPFDGMSRYPYADSEAHPHRDFLDKFLTRAVDPEQFWNHLRSRTPQGSPRTSHNR